MQTSRRDFLRTSALGLAAGLASDRLAFGEESGPVMGNSVRWGIIGTGARSRHHIKAMKMFSDMDILAACDVDEGRLQLGLERIGKPVAVYKEYQKLLARPDINAVLVCTPNLCHKEMVVAALEAGKHVLCEKPMATTWEECLAMKKAEDDSERVVMYGLQLRYSRRYRQLREIIQSGKIGAPQYVLLPEYRGDWNRGNVWRYTDPVTGKQMNWRFSQVASGGTLNEKMCHYFDIINWMLDDVPTRIYGNGGITHYEDGRETWDHASVHLEYRNGVKALVSLCMFGPKRLDPQIIGEEGSLLLLKECVLFQGTGPNAKKQEEISLTKEVGHGQKGTETAVLEMYQDFRDCVKNGRKPHVDAEKAMPSSKIAWLAELSAERHAETAWDELG